MPRLRASQEKQKTVYADRLKYERGLSHFSGLRMMSDPGICTPAK
jgi:hypothetical protein